MQSRYLLRIDKPNDTPGELIMFFAGWGMDERPFRHIKSDTYDVIIFYNYKHLYLNECITLLFNLFCNYRQISVIAWSLGVLGACAAFEKYFNSIKKVCSTAQVNRLMKKIERCIAINGTIFPISGTWGIPQEIFEKTIDNLPQGLDKFNLRMCGNKAVYEQYILNAPEREGEEMKQELISIKENFNIYNPITWNKAIISSGDNIFPAKNQRTFWEDYKECANNNLEIKELHSGHYPFSRWNKWEEIINF